MNSNYVIQTFSRRQCKYIARKNVGNHWKLKIYKIILLCRRFCRKKIIKYSEIWTITIKTCDNNTYHNMARDE